MTNGKAYAFFDCTHPQEHIEVTLPDVQDEAHTQLNLELRIGVSVDENDLRTEMPQSSFRYTLIGKLPDVSNHHTAEQMDKLMCMLQMNPFLYESEEVCRREIVYHDGREWQQFRE